MDSVDASVVCDRWKMRGIVINSKYNSGSYSVIEHRIERDMYITKYVLRHSFLSTDSADELTSGHCVFSDDDTGW